jgi:hypothetical protein
MDEVAAVAINTEVARFNMIRRQIQPWDVLDAGVPALLNAVRRSGENSVESENLSETAPAPWDKVSPRERFVF